jgi:hypothetical protein
MISKHYCPKCNSFDLFKLHRSFVEKRILGSQNKFQCKACEQVFKPSLFESNIPKEVPVFIDQIQQSPIANAVPQAKVITQASVVPPAKVASQADVAPEVKAPPRAAVKDPIVEKVAEESVVDKVIIKKAVDQEATIEVKQTSSSTLSNTSSQMMLNGDFMSEDNFKVTETVKPKADEQKAAKKPKVRKAPPAHKGGEQFVDEPILTTEKKGVWPYALASAMVLLGAAYTFVWMPLTSNASTSDITQMDMSIGSPGKVWSDAKAKVASVLPEVVNLKDYDTVEKRVENSSAQLVSGTPLVKSDIQVKLEEIALGGDGNEPAVVEQSAQALLLAKAELSTEKDEVKVEQAIIDRDLKPSSIPMDSKLPVTQAASNAVKDFTLKHNIGTKADNALGGLSLAKKQKKAQPASPPVSAAVEPKQSNVVIETNDAISVPLPVTSVRQYVVKSAKPQRELKAAVNEPEKVRAVVTKTKVNTKITKKKSISSDNKKLLEQAAVKLMQQDLDKLF